MKKLIELLNQFEEEKKSDNHWGLTYDNELIGLGNIREARLSVISKEYGFIKWLVENDKIDREKFGNSETKSSKYSDFELSYDTPREDYTNTLLMELAIQDEPIRFLIEILR